MKLSELMQEDQDTVKLSDLMGATPPNTNKSNKLWFINNILPAISPALTGFQIMPTAKETFNENIGGSAELVNQATFGLLRPTLRAYGADIPEQTTPLGKIQRGVGGTAGFLGGGIGRLGAKATQTAIKAIPSLASKKLIPTMARGVIQGGVEGALMMPETGEGTDILKPKERATQAATFAAVRAAIPPLTAIVKGIRKIPSKLLRGGLSKEEAARIQTQYGTSTGNVVDMAKTKLKQASDYADNMYRNVFKKAPDNKFINVKPAIEEAGARLERLGLITKSGKLTQLGESEIARDSVYGKLLDFYKSADAISGVKNLQNKALTTSQMIRAMKADRQTSVNKEQYLFLRDKLNSLYKGKPSDIDVSKVVDKFYQSGEDSGLKGLQEARRLEKEAFRKLDKFVDAKGDLKIATEAKLSKVGTKRPLSKQDMDHIKELEGYINSPILSEAEKINKINQSIVRLKTIKKRGGDVALGAVGLEAIRRILGGQGE